MKPMYQTDALTYVRLSMLLHFGRAVTHFHRKASSSNYRSKGPKNAMVSLRGSAMNAWSCARVLGFNPDPDNPTASRANNRMYSLGERLIDTNKFELPEDTGRHENGLSLYVVHGMPNKSVQETLPCGDALPTITERSTVYEANV